MLDMVEIPTVDTEYAALPGYASDTFASPPRAKLGALLLCAQQHGACAPAYTACEINTPYMSMYVVADG